MNCPHSIEIILLGSCAGLKMDQSHDISNSPVNVGVCNQIAFQILANGMIPKSPKFPRSSAQISFHFTCLSSLDVSCYDTRFRNVRESEIMNGYRTTAFAKQHSLSSICFSMHNVLNMLFVDTKSVTVGSKIKQPHLGACGIPGKVNMCNSFTEDHTRHEMHMMKPCHLARDIPILKIFPL